LPTKLTFEPSLIEMLSTRLPSALRDLDVACTRLHRLVEGENEVLR
jgi:hypothetical protein